MKHLLALSLLVSGVVAEVSAQKFSYGMDAGINIANQRVVSVFFLGAGSNTYFYNNLVRPTVSFYSQYNASERLGLRLSLRYSGMGYQIVSPSTSYYDYVDKKVRINYLTVPLTLHIAVSDRVSVNAGGYLSFTLGGNDLNGKTATTTFHKNDHGIQLGTEVKVYKDIAIGVSYVIGLKNIWLNDFGDSYIQKNRALQLTVSYPISNLLKHTSSPKQ